MSNYIDDFSTAQANKSENEQAPRPDVLYDLVQNVLLREKNEKVAVGMIAEASQPMIARPHHHCAHLQFISTS